MKKKNIFNGIIVLIIWYLGFFSIFYFSYMKRSERAFRLVTKETYSSKIINKNIGKVKKVKLNNFMVWISNKNGYKCVKLKVTTVNNKKYKVCAIIEDYDNYNIKTTGYIINGKIIKK